MSCGSVANESATLAGYLASLAYAQDSAPSRLKRGELFPCPWCAYRAPECRTDCLYCRGSGEVEAAPDGCYVMPDGACVSPFACVHKEKK